MAIPDLNKTVLYRKVLGITCPACTGLLEAVKIKTGLLRKLSSKKEKANTHYRCHGCRKHYLMSEIG